MQALQVFAGHRARERLRECGLRPEDVRVIAGAAGGPKGLVLNPLDQLLFGRWLAGSTHTVHLLGASIGAWRLACATLDDPARALARLAEDYINEQFPTRPDGGPLARQMSATFGERLREHFEGREAEALNHPRYRLHVFTSLGRGPLLRREGRVRTPLGYLGAFTTNLVSRRAMGGWLQRVIFSDMREPLPLHLHDYRTHQVALGPQNLSQSVLASCSIPFVLSAVHDIPGAPAGAYWDGGITDYHLHLDYASMAEGLVLYPHFQRNLVPGWLDKGLRHRHRASARLANVVVLAPSPEWVKTLPNGKLPDRADFKAYGADHAARAAHWRQAMAMSRQLAEEFEVLAARPSIDAEPLG
jgi:hypothetical protein